MRRLRWLTPLLLVALVGTGAAKCDDRGGGAPPPPQQGGNGGQPPAAGKPSGEFAALIAVQDKNDQGRSRTVVCDVTGLNADGQVVEITDEQTKVKTAYVLKDIRIRTHADRAFRLTLRNYGGVHIIRLICELQSQPGDTIFLEVLTGDERHAAPLIESVEVAETGKGRRAHVSATILAGG